MNAAPYTAPNSLDTVTLLEERIARCIGCYLPDRYFRLAEIFACLQTLDEAVRESAMKSRYRQIAAQTWFELVGDLVANLPVMRYRNEDPFSVARKDFTPSPCPGQFRDQLQNLLTLMVKAAHAVIGDHAMYVANYHGVICYQLSRLKLVTQETSAAYHLDVLHMPEPQDSPHSCLVYPPNYTPDHVPRGSEDDFDLTDYEHLIHKKTQKTDIQSPMNHSTVAFRGPAALPGVFLCLTRVNRGHTCFFNLCHTGHMKAGAAYSPLNSISYRLATGMHDYPIKQGIIGKGWKIEDCAFRMWLIGSIEDHLACSGLSFHDACMIALIIATMIREHLQKNGHEANGLEIKQPCKNKRLHENSLILFEEYLHNIFPNLLEDMDLNSYTSNLDANHA